MKDLVDIKCVTIYEGGESDEYDTVLLDANLELNIPIIEKSSRIELKVDKGKAKDFFTSLYKDKDVKVVIVGSESKDE